MHFPCLKKHYAGLWRDLFWQTGTIVVTLKGLFKNEDKVTHCLLSEALEICYDSWFGKHLSTDAMKVGTNNKYLMAEKLSTEDYVIEFYDFCLLQSKKYPFLGVSPDAIVKIKIGGNLFYACVEIKTRCAVITIQNAVSAAQAH